MTKLEQLQTMWAEDAAINSTNVEASILMVPKLHAKYLRELGVQRIKLAVEDGKHKQALLKAWQFIDEGPSKENMKEWGEKFDINNIPTTQKQKEHHFEADPDVIDANVKLAYQKEIVEFLKEVLKEIGQLQWHIKNLIENRKFLAGN